MQAHLPQTWHLHVSHWYSSPFFSMIYHKKLKTAVAFYALYDSGSLAYQIGLIYSPCLLYIPAHGYTGSPLCPSPGEGLKGLPMKSSGPSSGRRRGLHLRPDKALDAYHTVTFKFGRGVMACHNVLRYTMFDLVEPKIRSCSWQEAYKAWTWRIFKYYLYYYYCNDPICWKCVPPVVETFGVWGRMAGQFSLN